MTEPITFHIQKLSRFQPLTDNDIVVFESYKNSIDTKIRETFSSIPATFQLTPVRVCRTQGCGTFYDYKVALPDNKFATISFHTGGLQMFVGDEKPKRQDPSINVKPELTSTPEE